MTADPADPADPAVVAERFGTPAYVYDLADVRAAHGDLRAALPDGVGLHYSLKANPHPDIVAALAALGCHAEVSSTGEIDNALAAGVDPARVRLTGPGKSATMLDHALTRGVRRFSVDSPADLGRVGARAAAHGVPVTCQVRVNADEKVPRMGMTMTGVASQFGADASWITRDPAAFRRSGAAVVTGLHFYAGTNLPDEETVLRQFDVAVRLAADLAPLFPDLTEINLGGGFGAPYAREGHRTPLTGLAAALGSTLDGRLPGWRDGRPAVSVESGRYLVATCGTLVSRIVEVKESKGRTFVVLDAGVNTLGGMSGLQRLLPVRPTADVRPAGPPVSATLVGPLCTPLDTFGRDVVLAGPRPGGLVTVPNVGAYGLTASLIAFLGHPAPVEVVVDRSTVVSATRLRLDRVDCTEEALSSVH